ncbi:receptor-type tyrosine-protein phosphatase C isoform X3 [Pleuronectes platessa]|uniref:receptor-type tyrosine-protein phosphatase C isoform X3 n=1 Tax=Pleuronectes platessa TaxID=8262 RepID=UPI00232A54A0|nr:receptor-type tyrosine-protein phosphatase C isoform X3 [Pleuronectes platessa]
MAGLRGVKILLLWAGIIGLAKCYRPYTTDNAPTPSSLTSTEVTWLTTTVDNTTPDCLDVKNINQTAPTQFPVEFKAELPPNCNLSIDYTCHVSYPRRDYYPWFDGFNEAKNLSELEPFMDYKCIGLIKDTNNVNVYNTTEVKVRINCGNYTVKPIKFGLQINITSSAVNPVPTSIMIHEEGKPQTAARSSAPHSNPSSSHEIKQLKPCTKYEFNVTLDDKDRPTPCERMTVNDPITDPISEHDIEDANCYFTVCYQSGWDISSLQTTPDMIPDLQCGNNTVCFKPGSDDICSNMTFTFTSCTNTSFQFDRNITRDFLDVKNIKQTAPTQFPIEFKAELHPNCNLSIDYTCHGYYPEFHIFNEAMNLSELEPFMDYECIGLIKDKNNVNVYNTTEVKVRIDCDLKIDFTITSTTNTSSQLTCTTTSNRCKDVIQNLPKLSFLCRCGDSSQRVRLLNQTSVGTCYITDLQPYTVYTCWVQPYYLNDWEGRNPFSVKQKTEIGVPEDVHNLKLEVKDHNTIIVTCNHSQIFNGPERIFKAQLHYGGSSVERNDETCEFEFKNLKYSTNYTVKVTAVNRLFESNPITKQISTEYVNAGMGFHVFHILLTSGALLLVVYKIYDLRFRKSE